MDSRQNTAFALRAVLEQGASVCSSVKTERLAEYETERMAARRRRLDFSPTHALVAAFSYYMGHSPGNIPLYARGINYHLTNRARLERACDALRKKYPGSSFYPSGNGYPLPVVQAARLAGMGKIGAHGLLIIPGLGTWHTLGAILTDLELDAGTDGGYCENCGLCARACPFGALEIGEAGRVFHRERCVSFVSQQKELSAEQEEMVRRSPWVMWCDACQNVCPHNRNIPHTELSEYHEGIICNLTSQTVELIAPDRRLYEKKVLLARNLRLRGE